MISSNPRRLFGLRVAAALLWLCVAAPAAESEPKPLLLVVMDPLSRELACACVEGFGQRNYRKLATRLEATLKQRVAIEFSDDLADALSLAGGSSEVLVVGDRSQVADGAAKAEFKCQPICELSGTEGDTTLGAVFLARASDPAKTLADLAGRQFIFGLAEADGKTAAAVAALRTAGVEPPAQPERRAEYTDAALDVLDSSESPPPVAVIPAYGPQLLTGCGSVKPGEMKVIGTTAAVPFITVFVADAIAAEKREKILQALLAIKTDAALLKAMESRDGFKPLTQSRSDTGWPDWRGPRRDGTVPQLPARLPEKAKVVWKKPAMTGGLAGLSASDGRLIVAERDFADENDVYRCLDADTGELLWRVEFPAPGSLDYGQSPRATPVIREGRAFLLGAFGELRCVNVADGKVIWKRDLLREFEAKLPTWGMCSPPLIVDDFLVVNPGGPKASLAALDCATGHTRWTTPGNPAAYGAFICGEFGGRRQIVGHDEHSLGGWDVANGQRLWELIPPMKGDFGVPTPIAFDGGILVATENNGTRLYRFDQTGRIVAKPACEFAGLAPDTATPVVSGGRLFGAHGGLHCLDVRAGLKPAWHREEPNLGEHVALMADAERVLVVTMAGELILLDARSERCGIVSRLRLFDDDDVEMYSHPALVGSRLYARGTASVVCVDLQTN